MPLQQNARSASRAIKNPQDKNRHAPICASGATTHLRSHRVFTVTDCQKIQ